MPLFLNSLTIDQLETIKQTLNVAFIVATLGVWLGVFLENEKFAKPIQSRGWSILVAALATETLLGAALWQGDSEISRRQRIETEELRSKNLDFESAISPRILEQGLSAKALSRFSGTQFVVISPNDFEPRRTAGQIRFMLLQANWTRYVGPLAGQLFSFSDGVVVSRMGIDPSNRSAEQAVEQLLAILAENHIDARAGAPLFYHDEKGALVPPTFSPGKGLVPQPIVLVVEVGPKPLPASLKLAPDIRADERGGKVWGNIAE